MQQGICYPEFYGDSVYKFKKIIGTNLFKRIVNRFKRAGYILDIIRQTACLVSNQSWLKAMLHSLIARRWFRLQTQLGFDVKLEIVGCSLMIVFGWTLRGLTNDFL